MLISEKLARAGWTKTTEDALGYVVWLNNEPYVAPRSPEIGASIPLHTLLPPGASVGGKGTIEYKPAGLYVRIRPGHDFEHPFKVLYDVAHLGADVTP